MIALITDIINRFGPRLAGSEAEKNAQLYIAELCKKYTNNVSFLPFDEHLAARFGKLKYYVAFYFISLALFWVSAEAALAVSLVSVFFLAADMMMYRDVLTSFPGKLETSSNVEAVLEPQGEVKSTLIFSGHMDSTREFRWWYKLGQLGIVLTVVAGVLMALQLIFLLVYVITGFANAEYVWGLFLLLSPVTVVYWSMHADEVVPGAQDNLSGIAIAFDTFKTFADANNMGKSTLQHTRIKFVSFGSEEPGLCGSRAYAQLKKEELRKENAHLINIDGVRVTNEVAVVEKELMNGTKHSPVLLNGLRESFKQQNIPLKTGSVPIGGTDAVSLARVGIPTVTVIGISSSKYDFTYHTRHDVIENIEPQSLENAKNGIVAFVSNWDRK